MLLSEISKWLIYLLHGKLLSYYVLGKLTRISQYFPMSLRSLKMQAVTGMRVRDMSSHAFFTAVVHQ